MMSSRDHWVEEALQQFEHLQLLMSMRPVYLHHGATQEAQKKPIEDELDVFDEMQPWDRSSVKVHISEPKFLQRLHGIPVLDEEGTKNFKRLLLFSENDYLGLGSHPTIGKAASKVALHTWNGPQGFCFTLQQSNYAHRLLLSLLCKLQKLSCIEMLRWWDHWVEEALQKLEHLQLLRSLRPIYLQNGPTHEAQNPVEDEMQPWDRSSLEVQIPEPTFQKWLHDIPSSGDEEGAHNFRKLLLFSGNDYLGLSSHPTIGKAASKAPLEHGMGPRGSALICGYTDYHRRLESCIADLKKKEE